MLVELAVNRLKENISPSAIPMPNVTDPDVRTSEVSNVVARSLTSSIGSQIYTCLHYPISFLKHAKYFIRALFDGYEARESTER